MKGVFRIPPKPPSRATLARTTVVAAKSAAAGVAWRDALGASPNRPEVLTLQIDERRTCIAFYVKSLSCSINMFPCNFYIKIFCPCLW